MAQFVYAMNVSLDGYVDHEDFEPDATLFRHWIEQVRGATASIYGRRIYEIMQYWEQDQAEWSTAEQEFAVAWRNQPKWVVSRSLSSVGPNATLVSEDIEPTIRELKERLDGRIDVCGTIMAHSMTELGLIDEYRIYYHPTVLGGGKPFFAGPRPPLRLVGNDRFGDEVVRLTYAPA